MNTWLRVTPIKNVFWKKFAFFYETYTKNKPYIDINFSLENTILVAGSPRSGTTWIGNVIANSTRRRQIFEPFIIDNNMKNFIFLKEPYASPEKQMRNYQMYIREHDKNSFFQEQIEQILRGKIWSAWTDQQITPNIYWKRLIKAVRANLFLSYIARTWPQVKIIWIVRHPEDVVFSQLSVNKRGYGFEWYPNFVLDQKDVLTDWLEPHTHSMSKIESDYERLTHKWCIETMIPMRQKIAKFDNVIRIRYEHLVNDFKAWKVIQEFIKEDWDFSVFKKEFEKQSHTSFQKNRSSKHLTSFTVLQRGRIKDIVQSYGLEKFLDRQMQTFEACENWTI